ncbi:hypothetical protein MNV49_005643 [Pseudohyphozyma bogoriensis]|nr:hypothetical protein MNV49_005643 [Pseudohyphozyma bogoriensis]
MITFTSNACGPGKDVMIYMGKDKYENEELIRYALPEKDIWLHVDKLSSAHVYLRMPEWMTIDTIPPALLADAAQLVKANSIVGNKTDNITVTFHNDKKVKRTYVAERLNPIVNRLNKTKKVDHEAELVARQKEEGRIRRMAATERKNSDLELARQRKAEVEARSYKDLHGAEEDEDEAWERRQKEGDFDPEEDFM